MLLITDGNPRGLGYMELDHRATDAPPGLRHFEADTFTCSHCQRVEIINRNKINYKCSGCSHHICDRCAAAKKAGAPCKTYAQYVEEQLEQAQRQPEPSLIILP
jgi:hypothetical protein